MTTHSLSAQQNQLNDDQIHLWYDGPMLFSMAAPAGGQWLFAGLPDEAGRFPFLVAHLSDQALRQALDSEITLQAAFRGAQAHFLVRDFDAPDAQLEPLEAVPQQWLPGDTYLDFHKHIALQRQRAAAARGEDPDTTTT